MAKKRRKRKMKKNARIAAYVVLVVSICAALFAGWQLYKGLHNYAVGEDVYNKMRENTVQKENEEKEEETVVDFAALKAINEDICGWIRLKDSNIDYPFVYADDNEYYLDHAFDGSYTTYGTVFLDARAPEPFKDTETVLYGHHMKDGAMFADVENYKDPSYYKTHKVFEVILENEEYYMYPVAGRLISGEAGYVQFNFADEASFNNYVKGFMDNTTFKSDETLVYGCKIMMLSTCSYEYNDARYVLIGKLVKKVKLDDSKS